MHKLLQRQLKRFFGSLDAVPPPLKELLDSIEEAYHEADKERLLLERSLELTSQELLAKNDLLRAELTERQLATEALQQAQLELRQVIEKSPYGIVVRRDERWVLVNQAWAGFLGYDDPAELLGRRGKHFMHPEDLARFEQGSLPVSPCGVPLGEVRMLHRDGEVITLDIAPAQIITFDGQPAFLVVAQDVTEKKKLQAHLLFSERMASLGTLAAGVAHEINNPLAYVIANLEFASQEIASISNIDRSKLSEISTSLKDAEEGAQRVRQIVRDLKIFSRADEETRTPTDPRKALEGALSMAWNELRHRARVVKELRPVPAVLINEARLGQVFLNLLVNAAQAIPPGNVNQHEIKLRSFTTPFGLVIFEIEDTGVGIPQDKLSKIFDPFFTTKPVGVGTGLGLSICHALVSSVGGQIQVESRLGVGTLFRVILPSSPTGVSPAAPTSAPTPVPERARVLVIDDEVSICSVLKRSLSAHDVTTRHSAAEALDLLRAETYDVVLCDLMMPAMTGIELFETLSRELPWVCPRVIFLTGGAFTPAAKEFLEKNSNLKFEKPFSIKELKSAIQAML